MTEGQVIHLDERCDNDDCTYRPVVEFNDQDGQNFTVLRWIFIVAGAGAVIAGFVMFAQALRDGLIAGE